MFFWYQLETSEEVQKISTDDERKSFIEKLDEVNISFLDNYACYSKSYHLKFLLKREEFLQVQEWLYMDGEDASATEFQERLDMLKAIGDPMFFRCVLF